MEELQVNQTELPPQPEKPSVPLRDRAMAIALLALGYLVCRVEIHNYPLLGLVYGLILYGLTVWYFRARMRKRALAALAVGLVLLFSHLFTDNGSVRFFARWIALLLWGYGVYCAGDNSQEERLGDMFVPEFLKANVLMPFSRLGAFFAAVFTGGRRNWLRTALFVLLLQYDVAFESLLRRVFTEDLPTLIFWRLLYLMLAVAAATLLMSAMRGSEEHRLSRVLDRERWNVFSIRRRFLPLTVSGAMLIPLLLLYGLFFFSQWPVYTAAFTGVLPQGWTYADYAREGFFQLCAVCAINAVLYLFVSLFTKMGKGQGFRRALLTALCLCSLILAATAFSKMVLYIKTYGLTPNRVYASWAMILLTGAFLLALIGTYWRKMNMTRALLLLFTALFGFLCLWDTNAMIAGYNVRAYEQGRLDSVDTSVFWDLGDSAVPAAARLADDPVYGDEMKRFLSNHGQRDALAALCHGLPGLRARAICQPYWRQTATVRVRIETEDDFAALSCWFGEMGYEHSAGSAVNANNTPLRRGDTLFFELEPVAWDGWSPIEDGEVLRFQLSVTDGEDRERLTNVLSGAYGEEIRVALTGSAETGYTIARAD